MNQRNASRRPVTVDEEQLALRCARGRVVVIDDDVEILAALSALMDLEGYACETYACAADYLNMLTYNRPSFAGPACVLCDVKMPEIDGLELLQRLAELDDTPLVLISGASSVHDVARGFRSGALDFLIKPMDADLLLASVARALASSTQRQQARLLQADLARRLATLTPRERDIARRIASGQTNPEVAQALGIALRTAKLHRQRALEKLGVESLPALVRLSDQCQL